MQRRTVSAGGVVLNSQRQVLVVSQKGKSWSLPKGHVEPSEDLITTAKREITEESGLTELEYVKDLIVYERQRGDDPTEWKEIHLFLFKTNQSDLKPVDPDNPEARWVEIEKVVDLLTYEKDKEAFRGIIAHL